MRALPLYCIHEQGRCRKLVYHYPLPLFLIYCMKTTLILETYCVGIDISKDKLDVCLMARYNDHSTKIKATKKFDNTPKSMATLHEWVQSHTKGLASCVLCNGSYRCVL